jgi:hypothetical protein
LNRLARERKRALILDRSSASSSCNAAARLRSGALPNANFAPDPPRLRMEPALPIERIDPALPMLRIEPALPMLSTEPALNRLPRLRKLYALYALPKLERLCQLGRSSMLRRVRPMAAKIAINILSPA